MVISTLFGFLGIIALIIGASYLLTYEENQKVHAKYQHEKRLRQLKEQIEIEALKTKLNELKNSLN